MKCRICGKIVNPKHRFEQMVYSHYKFTCPECAQKEHEPNEYYKAKHPNWAKEKKQ